MPKIIFILFLALIPLLTSSAQAGVMDDYICGVEERPLRFSGFPNYPPFLWTEQRSYVDSMGERKYYRIYRGFALDLLDEIAKGTNLPRQAAIFRNQPTAKRGLELGYTDLIISDYYEKNEFLAADYLYPSYLANPFTVISLKGNMKNITKPEDLKGKKIGIRWEEGFSEFFKTLPTGITAQGYYGARDAYKALLSREVDYLITSQYAHEAEARRFKILDYVETAPFTLRTPNFFFLISRRDKCSSRFKDFFQRRLKEISADKTLIKTLLAKNLREWEKIHRDEPSMLLETGFQMQEDVDKKLDVDIEELERIRIEIEKEKEKRKLL